ncbi:hypothetical protein [Nitrosomonas communis]|uniref:Uncharacterized protein n=1 Tax=Nitrosomonas communis TaxID=44574 RepID=A0A1I4U8G6_9PROT|nr:hypothetical protein [Nitrosomonas communis]SFM85227.1 hypothetical protein SAMN05421863_10618 [Nitrosomonas communis]
MAEQKQLKKARLKAWFFTKQAAKLIGVKKIAWQRWEEQAGRKTEIPFYCWELFAKNWSTF